MSNGSLAEVAVARSSLEVRPRGAVGGELPSMLRSGPASIAELEDAARRADGGLLELYASVHAAADVGLVTFASGPGPDCLAELRPMAPGFRLAPLPEGRVALSRFAHVRREGDGLVLESPLGVGSIRLLDAEALSTLWELSAGVEVGALVERARRPNETRALLELLASDGLIGVADADRASSTDKPAPLQQWEFHDLIFHHRSRGGRHDRELGATYRFTGKLEPAPALARPPEAPTIALPAPWGPPRLDGGIVELLARRASVREQSASPITIRELGELLYHACRVIEVVPGALGPVTSRPYPSGGANYELEVYPVVDRCLGLAPGFYRYDAQAHRLSVLHDPDPDTDALLDGASAASATTIRPQVLLTIAARFQRQSWKYSGMAYATILKDVGALYATLYLVATAMGLAPCALGAGDSERFCRLAGTDRYTEASVGEFMISSRP